MPNRFRTARSCRLPRRRREACKRVAATEAPSLLTDVLAEVTALRADVERATSRNMVQQQQVNTLHAELQEHKNGLLAQLQRPWAMGLIQLFDALNREAKDMAVAEATFSARDVALMMEGFRDDVEIVLDQLGVNTFKSSDTRFNPVRQTAVKTIPAPEPHLAGMVLLRLRPGFEHNGKILRKEWVCVYADCVQK